MRSAASRADVMSEAGRAAIEIFCAYVTFVVTGLAFISLSTIHGPTSPDVNPLMVVAWLTVAGGALIASLAVLAAGIPLAIAALVRAAVSRRRDLWLVLVPFPALLVYFLTNGIGFAGGSLAYDSGLPGIVCAALGLLAALTSTAVVTRLVTRNVHGAVLYRLALIPGVVVVGAMALALFGVTAWGVLASLSTSFAHAPGLLGLPVWLSWLAVVLGMFAATCFAAVALLRGIFTRALLRDLRALVAIVAGVLAFLRGVVAGRSPSSTLMSLRERYARERRGALPRITWYPDTHNWSFELNPNS
jgi:hypothetical protein